MLLPISVAAKENAPIFINLQQADRLDGATTTATLYLKRLIEQRTDQRLVVTLYPSAANHNRDGNQQAVAMQMTATVTDGSTLANPGMQILGEQAGNSYRILIDLDFWNRLSDELQIILQGAAKDTIAYFSELERKN